MHTPIVTASDCEGAGEMFQVTTLLSKIDEAAAAPPTPSPEALAVLREALAAQGAAVKEAKAAAGAAKGDKELAARSKAEVGAELS